MADFPLKCRERFAGIRGNDGDRTGSVIARYGEIGKRVEVRNEIREIRGRDGGNVLDVGYPAKNEAEGIARDEVAGKNDGIGLDSGFRRHVMGE